MQRFKPWVQVPTSMVPLQRGSMVKAPPPLLKTRTLGGGCEPGQKGLQAALQLWGWAGLIAAPALTYHGFKRTNSVGWAVAWSAFGAILPFLSVPIALAQGFGKPKRRS